MSYDDDNPEIYSAHSDDDQSIIELERQQEESLPDVFPWFENEADLYEDIANQELEYPYD